MKKKEFTFIGKIMVRSGRSVLCIGIPREVKEIVKIGETYQVTVKLLKGGDI